MTNIFYCYYVRVTSAGRENNDFEVKSFRSIECPFKEQIRCISLYLNYVSMINLTPAYLELKIIILQTRLKYPVGKNFWK